MANKEVLLQYTRWALEGLSLQPAWEFVRPKLPDELIDQFSSLVWPTFQRFVSEDLELAKTTLREARTSFKIEGETEPARETYNYQLMLAAILASVLGDTRGILHLGALLVTESLNRKLSISYFLGNLTDGVVGTMYKEIPSKEQVTVWAERILKGDVKLEPILKDLAQYRQNPSYN